MLGDSTIFPAVESDGDYFEAFCQIDGFTNAPPPEYSSTGLQERCGFISWP